MCRFYLDCELWCGKALAPLNPWRALSGDPVKAEPAREI